jgi:hypothetical protein
VSEVDFSSLSKFCRTYLLMIKALELNWFSYLLCIQPKTVNLDHV